MGVKWSNEQLTAIEERNKSILVNAGAGSGKTAVLAERLLKEIESGVHLENLIVLTFTKLAASEMKERLRKKLIEHSSTNPHLKEELAYIDQANIQTFDAYTNELVRKYHYLLDIPQEINIVDNASFEMELIKIVTSIFNNYYQEQNQLFLNLIDKFTTKDDKKIINYCIKLYKKVILDANYIDKLSHYDAQFSEQMLDEYVLDFTNLIKDKLKVVKYYLQLASKYTSDSNLDKHYQKILNEMNKVYQCKTYDEYLLINTISFPNIPSKVEDEEEKIMYSYYINVIKDELKNIKEMLIYSSGDEIRSNILNTKDDVSIISEILLKTDLMLKGYKKATNSYDFNDIALMAINLLESNDSLREKIKHQTYEILVDEYQDTSDIQERLINLIENNNVYMVGDVKQSIYRFRNANPDIFKNKYAQLQQSNNGMVIDLSKNFRSRFEVLDGVNTIFERIMSINIGGVDYNESHALVYGNKDYDNFIDKDYRMKVLTYNHDKEFLENYPELKEYSNAEIEAFIIGRDILSRIGKQKVYDKDLRSFRPIRLSDFAILTSDKDKFELYKEIFEYLHLPLKIYKEEVFIDNDEVYVFTNILKLIYSFYDNKYGCEQLKSSLVGVLRSFLVNGDDRVISQIICSENIKEEFCIHFPNEYKIINELASILDYNNLNEIVEKIFDEFDIYNHVLMLDNIESVELRLNHIKEMISNLVNLDYSVIEVIEYFDTLINENDKFEVRFSPKDYKNSEAIKMMSIHASKGLEFPVCYFPETYKSFNFSDTKDAFIYSKKYQIIVPFYKDNLLMTNVLKIMEENDYHREEVSEKIRLLYVAFTRPREEMVIVCPSFELYDKVDENKISDFIKEESKSFYDLLSSISFVLKDYCTAVDHKRLGLSKDYQLHYRNEIKKSSQSRQQEFFTVEVKRKEINKTRASKSSIKYHDKEELRNLSNGVFFHKLLELVDFENPDYTSIQADEHTIGLIKDFLESDFITSKKIVNTYHEYQYRYCDQGIIKNGIIDLVIETEKDLYVVDYKLSNIDDEAYVKQINTYKDYLKTVSNKNVYGYLYSINKRIFKEV